MNPNTRRAQWNLARRREVTAAASRMGLVINQQNQGVTSVQHNAHRRRYATESELNDPNHKKEDDFVIKAIPPQSAEAKASETFILARQVLGLHPCRLVSATDQSNVLQGCSLDCCSRLPVDKIVTLGLGERGDGTVRWSANHLWFATIVDQVLKALVNSKKNTSNIEIHYQTTEIDGVECGNSQRTLLGVEPGFGLVRSVNVKVKSDFNTLDVIDNNTVVVLLSRDNPWRQFLGNICLEKEMWPAMIICVPCDEEPTQAEPNSKGEVISRDEKSEALNRVLSEGYKSYTLTKAPVWGSFAGGQPREVLVDRLDIYVRRV